MIYYANFSLMSLLFQVLAWFLPCQRSSTTPRTFPWWGTTPSHWGAKPRVSPSPSSGGSKTGSRSSRLQQTTGYVSHSLILWAAEITVEILSAFQQRIGQQQQQHPVEYRNSAYRKKKEKKNCQSTPVLLLLLFKALLSLSLSVYLKKDLTNPLECFLCKAYSVYTSNTTTHYTG